MATRVFRENSRNLSLLTAVSVKTKLASITTIGSTMFYYSKANSFAMMHLLLGVLMSYASFSAFGQTVENIPVNIFGDGDPDNGVEDNREQVMGGRQGVSSRADHHMNAGTVMCDGKVRGTAMVLDTREFAPDLKGVVLATAAHVIYDLDKKQRFKRCEFQFMALSELSRYKARIDLGRVRLGGFDPMEETSGADFGEGDWAFLYVPRPWKNFSQVEAITLRDFSFVQMESYRQSGGELRLVAFSSTDGVISVSRNCTVIESNGDDLGGGSWKGQLLDDCDSVGGASGGGIVAVLDGRQYLIGIRSGSHWSEQVYPAGEYPAGPPDGSLWNRHSNTNFGRAIDTQLISQLLGFLRSLEDGVTPL